MKRSRVLVVLHPSLMPPDSLDGQEPKTLEEIGETVGVTRERIRQLQNIALLKLRGALRRRERSRLGPLV